MKFSESELGALGGLSPRVRSVLSWGWTKYYLKISDPKRMASSLSFIQKNKTEKIRRKFLSNLEKYNASLNAKFLALAVDDFYATYQEINMNMPPASGMFVMGWLKQEGLRCFSEMRADFTRLKSHVFRPDVAFLFKSVRMLFSGFKIFISAEAPNFTDQSIRISNFLSNPSVSVDSMIPVFSDLTLEGRLTNLFLSNPKETSQIIEVCFLVSQATLIIQTLDQVSRLSLDDEQQRCLIKLILIAGPDFHNIARRTDYRILQRFECLLGYDSEVYSLASPKHRSFNNVSIQKGDSIFSDQEYLVYDKVQNPNLDFVAGKWDTVIGSHVEQRFIGLRSLPNSGVEIDRAILLGGRADENWFHWLIETLPRIFNAQSVDINIPLLISSSIPPSAKQSLALISNRRIIEINRDSSVFVKELVVPNPVLYHPDTMHLYGSESIYEVDAQNVKQLRETVFSNLGILESTQPTKKYFVLRRGANRAVVNSRTLEIFLSILGFEILDTGSMSFEAQVRAFASASIVVSPGGAAMANYIFMNRRGKAITLQSQILSTYLLPNVLTKFSSGNSLILTGKPVGVRKRAPFLAKFHSSYRISILKLLVILFRAWRS